VQPFETGSLNDWSFAQADLDVPPIPNAAARAMERFKSIHAENHNPRVVSCLAQLLEIQRQRIRGHIA